MTRSVDGRGRLIVVAVCAFAVVLDGYDLTVYGAVVPSLLDDSGWDVSEARAGVLGSYALVGMLVGALLSGTLTDLVGHRRVIIGCVAWFSAGMALSGFAPSPELFGVLRLLTGLGLGGVIPAAVALTMEYAEPHRRNVTHALMFTGYAVGGIVAALAAIPVLARFEWQTMFWLGALPALVLVPLACVALPESPGHLRTRGRGVAANAGVLFSRSFLAGTLLFWVASGMGMLMVYGLNTWLAEIMIAAGFPLGSSLSFLLVLNAGAIAGTPIGGALADRFGSKRVVGSMFLLAAAGILLMSLRPPTALLYLCVAVAGACTIGTTILVNSFTGTYYPASVRATGLGWALAVGRVGAVTGPVLGGLVMASGTGVQANFYAFAVPALVGALAVLAVPTSRAAAPRGGEPGRTAV